MIKDYSNSVIYADKVLSNPKTDDNVKSDANYHCSFSNANRRRNKGDQDTLNCLIAKGE
jgi:hypothetical protein